MWPDGYYMSANMFEAERTGFSVRLWGINKTPLLTGGPLQEVHFDLCLDGACGSFLPSNLRGATPPASTPNYFAQISAPGAWISIASTPTLSLRPTPPSPVPSARRSLHTTGTTAGSHSRARPRGWIAQRRLMMQLQYRNMGTHQSLWATHTVDEGGLAVTRWYEVRDPGGTPTLFQQGSITPATATIVDGQHRRRPDGTRHRIQRIQRQRVSRHPLCRPPERRDTRPDAANRAGAGQRTGSQTGIDRWGDYSAMSVDPNDDCIFWYTQEYSHHGSDWQTRIGSFKFPSCGQPKGTIAGRVINRDQRGIPTRR